MIRTTIRLCTCGFSIWIGLSLPAGRGAPADRGTAAPAPIVWEFDSARDVVAWTGLEPVDAPGSGRFAGETAWDPYLSLRLPAGSIDAGRYTWLSVRLYSSARADLLDVYYGSPDGHWCLGGRLQVAPGWATYRMDLTRNSWRETRTGPESRRWGGPTGRVSTLRIDPGNQAGRWIAIEKVTLEPARPGLEEGLEIDPRGRLRLDALDVPAHVEAGEPLRIAARGVVLAPVAPGRAMAFLRVRAGREILRAAERPVDADSSAFTFQAALPMSPYWNPGRFTVEFGCYEMDLDPGGAAPTAEVGYRNPRVGSAHPPDVTLSREGGDPTIRVNGEPMPGYLYVSEGGLHLEPHREAARAGIRLYADWLGGSTRSDLGHVAPDRYDYSSFDHYFAAILGVDPEARFLPHIGVVGPAWWQEANPQEMCVYSDGTRGPTSFASRRWRREIGEDYTRLIAHLRRAPYADRIIGYAFFSGYTAEWQMWGTWREHRCDYSAPALAAFREFLGARYGTDRALREAWGRPDVTLADAPMPGPGERRPGGSRVLRDPARERPAIDLYRFYSEMDAEALLHFARLTREATGGRALVGTYYAYLSAHGERQQDSGHLAARRVFDSPDIDFLMSPPNYTFRAPGETSTFMSATDSFRMRGKLWLDESDHRTHLVEPEVSNRHCRTLEESRGVFWREFAEVLTKRAAVSWFDMTGGWFSDPRLLADLRRAAGIYREAIVRPRLFPPEIAVLVDPESFYWMRPTAANAALVLSQVVRMPQAGAPWDYLLLDDLGDARMRDYRFYLFLNAFRIDDARREMIHRKLRRNGATALFLYAPGRIAPGGTSTESMRALTGMRIVEEEREGDPRMVLHTGSPLARALPAGQPLGRALGPVSPLFHVEDPAACVEAVRAGTSLGALATRAMDGWTSVYCAGMEVPPALIRELARRAGVHIWIETDDALYTDGRHIGLHAATDGVKLVTLPEPARVTDAISGEQHPGAAGRTFRLPLKRGESALLRLEPQPPRR